MKATYSLLALVLIAGCRTSISTQNHFVLTAERDPTLAVTRTTGVLDVHRLTMERTYDSKGFVYRTDLNEFAVDYYNGFLVSPSQMITERVRHWLSQADLFSRILTPGSQAEPTHALEGHILNLYGDFREDRPATAIFEIKFFLINHEDRSGEVILNKTYRETEPVDTHDASCLTHALDLCLERILTALEGDIAKALQ
ncbi:MAG: ABC-type transport auxiliary lipoprotein family protein [Phycisphaerae bacterium]|nr:ABC-type transport auxiliary lipoprotein family protein [Phycisphaerae bacterium]